MLEYARWKYFLIAGVLLVAVLFALPNVFGDDYALQMVRREIAAGRGTPLLRKPLEHRGIVELRRQVRMDAANADDIGNGLDVEDEDRRHAAKTPVDR